ncbi:hypothetical protein EPJ79_09780 [Brachyspira aalborgi]|uniref:Uncharacterized protein n=1 Tax=Brachyspira aalborgi TaxID=29522 RepID=A0A5C8D8L4_9SPIR|nr:hypothetical protein [Brachyspira aalborgi]TXJ21393.1 hypothetical protein EPJ79_09780 [Brachyspira aalborgi]
MDFKLPSLAYEQLKKIMMACGKKDINMIIERDELSRQTEINSDTISRNNAFLFSIGFLEKNDNNKNIITDIGLKLAKAYNLEDNIKIKEILIKMIKNNKDLNELIFAQLNKTNLTVEALTNIIINYFDKPSNQYAKIGANTLLEIFKEAEIISMDNNIIIFNKNEFENFNLDVKHKDLYDYNYTASEINNKNILNIPISNDNLNINININIDYDTKRNPAEILNTIEYILNNINIYNAYKEVKSDSKPINKNIENKKNIKKKKNKVKNANRNELEYIDIDKEFGKEKIEEWINFYKSLEINSAITSVVITVYWISKNINELSNRINDDYVYSFLIAATNNNIKFKVFDAISNASRNTKKLLQRDDDGLIITGIGNREVENNILIKKE